jgi:hypothetical protein
VDTNSVVIKAGTADFIAVAFYRVGYRPRESLVTVGLTGPRHQLGVVCRVDLPPARHRRAVVDSVLRMLRREGHDQLAALIVSDAEPPPGAAGAIRLPHRALVRELERRARRRGLSVLDVFAVNSSHWRSYRCPDATCCPAQGYDLEAALTGPAAARLIAEGCVLAPDEAALLADVDPRSPSVNAASVNAASVDAVSVDAVSVDAASTLNRWRALLADPTAVGTDDLAWLVEALDDHWLRDAVLLTLVPGAGTVPEEVLAGADPAVMENVFESVPDLDLLERGRVLLSAVARSAPPGRRADALALLAWAAWFAGHGSRGRLLAERALADSPTHRLARLVDQLLSLGVPPTWVERQREGEGRAAPAPRRC